MNHQQTVTLVQLPIPLKIVGVIASENNNGTNNSGNSVDGNMSSRWSAKGNEWIDIRSWLRTTNKKS